MAEFRNIHSKIWKDDWFTELAPDEKLVFIYLFSNERASVCGMYEMPIKFIAFETGVSLDRVSEIMDTLSRAGKVLYEGGVVWVVNLPKYNNSGSSPKIAVRAARDVEMIPDCNLKRQYLEAQKIPYPVRQIPYPKPQIPYLENASETDTDTDTDTDTETETETETETALGVGVTRETSEAREIYRAYEQEMGPLTPMIADAIRDMQNTYPHELIIQAFKTAALANKRSISYANGILRRWKEQGVQDKSGIRAPALRRGGVDTSELDAIINGEIR